MRETILHLAIITLVAGAVFYTNLGQARLWDRDEPRNAGCAAEMLQRGDWVVPTFNGELRHQKPVLLYWLMMSVYPVFGVNEFSARFWSATLGIITTIATYGIARRLTNPGTALLSAIALATCLMFDVAARAATPDSVLICCSTCSIYLYVLGVFSRQDEASEPAATDSWFPQNRFLVVAMYSIMGLGVLAKGPVGLIVPMAIIGMLMLIKRLPRLKQDSHSRTTAWLTRVLRAGLHMARPFQPVHFIKTFWAMKPLIAIPTVLIVAAPWYLMVAHATDGEFISKFFLGEHFGRATTAMENHSGGLWYYPLAILIGFFPWSVLWGPVAIDLLHQRKTNSITPVSSLMLCWIGVQVGLFSIAQTKLPSYVTPCYPALAILFAVCLQNLCRQLSLKPGEHEESILNRLGDRKSATGATIDRRWLYAAFAGLILSGLFIFLGLGAAASMYLPTQLWLASLGVIPIFGGTAMILMLKKQSTQRIPFVFASTSILFCWCAFGFGTVSIDREQQSHLLLEVIDANPQTPVAAFGCLESSWVFYGGKPIRELLTQEFETEPGHFDEATKKLDSGSGTQAARDYWKCKPRISVEAFLKSNSQAMFLTSSEHVDELKKRLPEDYEVIQTAAYFLKNKQIVLIGKPAALTALEQDRTYY